MFLQILLGTHSFNPITLTSVDYSIFICVIIPVLGGNLEIPDGKASFELYLYPMFAADILKAIT